MRFKPVVILVLVFLAGCGRQSDDELSSQQSGQTKQESVWIDPSARPSKALTIEDGKSSDQRLAELHVLATKQESASDFEAAIETRQKLVQLVESTYGTDSWQVVSARFGLKQSEARRSFTPQQHQKLAYAAEERRSALNFTNDGNRAAARDCYLRAVAAMTDVWGEESSAVTNFMLELAAAHQTLGEFDQADKVYHQVVEILGKHYGSEHPKYIVPIAALGDMYLDANQSNRARPFLLRAAELTSAILGVETLEYATRLNSLGICYQANGEFASARELHLSALATRRKLLGDEHPSCAEALLNLGIVERETKDWEDSIQQLTQAVHIYEATLGRSHDSTVRALSSLATTCHLAGQAEKAQSTLREVLGYYQSKYGKDDARYAECAYRLSVVLGLQGKYPEAERLIRHSIVIQERSYGADDARLLPVLQSHAVFLQRLGQLDDAAAVNKRMAALKTRVARRPR